LTPNGGLALVAETCRVLDVMAPSSGTSVRSRRAAGGTGAGELLVGLAECSSPAGTSSPTWTRCAPMSPARSCERWPNRRRRRPRWGWAAGSARISSPGPTGGAPDDRPGPDHYISIVLASAGPGPPCRRRS